jgi:DNA (cytosine-5)-methyltransferase 1
MSAKVGRLKSSTRPSRRAVPYRAGASRPLALRDRMGEYRVGGGSRKVVSLFSGAMGLDMGLRAAGLEIAVSQDIDPWCVETMSNNTTHPVVGGDIRKLLSDDPTCEFLLTPAKLSRDQVFAVVGGPPCQAFSTAGKRLGKLDERGGLYSDFIQVVESLRPRFFIMENVKGLVSMLSDPADESSDPLLETILRLFRARTGYKVIHGLLDAVHYGTPQFRERVVIIGSRDHEPVFLPAPTHFQLHQEHGLRWKTLREAISDLEDTPGACTQFSPRLLGYLRHVPEGGNWRSLPKEMVREAMGGAFEAGGGKVGFYRRLKYDEPSPTLVTSPVQKATILCHPTQLRPLSIREYMRIQEFPDTWLIKGAMVDCYRQIGNAVPVGLGRALGRMLEAVAAGRAHVAAKRVRGTSVHSAMVAMQEELFGRTNGSHD